jgi:predicted  nucleic acid-binding Zn-ribbon protein
MNDDIAVLIELSLADLECARLHERTEAIPRELERHQAALVVQKAALEEQERRAGDLQRERRGIERDADAAKTRRRELEVQQFRVKNNIEFQAMLREIDEMRRRASELEDQALALIGEEETAQAEIKRLKDLVAQEERKVSGVRERLEKELADYQAQLEKARKSREELAAKLSPMLRTRYERIRRSKGDMAVVGLEQGACGGCGYQLPPQKINEVQRMEHVVVCEGCGRMLVWIGH